MGAVILVYWGQGAKGESIDRYSRYLEKKKKLIISNNILCLQTKPPDHHFSLILGYLSTLQLISKMYKLTIQM